MMKCRCLLPVLMFISILMVGNSNAQSFIQAKGPLKGGVLLAYAAQTRVNQYFVDKLGHHLSQFGWSVLLLPLPSAENSEWEAILAEQLAVIRKKSNSRVILITYAMPWEPLRQYFLKPQSKQVSGLVLLSSVNEKVEVSETAPLQTRLRFPVFDIVAQFDYPSVLEAWMERKKARYKRYLTMKIPGGQHGYTYQERMLGEALNDWMLRLPKPKVYRSPL